MEEEVILVDEQDNVIGQMPKMQAHREGKLHRAFSVFIFNKEGALMLQKRASHKYHSPNLWTNSCCSHQRIQEDSLQAGHRRLGEEMGFDTQLHFVDTFIYQASFDNGLIEHELDHILMGSYDDNPVINPKEVGEWKWISLDSLQEDIEKNPDDYTPWLKIIMAKNIDWQQYLAQQ